MRRRAKLVCTTVLLATGCGGAPAAPAAPPAQDEVRDSAGVEIVLSRRLGWAGEARWQVSPGPILTLGTTEGDSVVQLHQVVGVVGLRGGRAAVLNGGSAELLLYDAGGNLVRRIGRRGQGPGEFGRPVHLTVDGDDQLSVWDFNYGPVSTFDTLGRLLHTRLIDLGRLMAALGPDARTERLHPMTGGAFIAQVMTRSERELPLDALVREPLAFVLVGDSMVGTSLGWYRGLSFFRRRDGERTEVQLPLFPVVATIASGGVPPRIYASDGETFALDVFDERGRLVRKIRREEPREAVHRDVVDSARREIKASGREGAARPIPTYLGPQHYPAIAGLRVDREGFLWARGRGNDWHVFTAAGRYLGPVVIPVRRVHDIGADYILGVDVDRDGVERVTRFALSRGAR